MVIDRTLLKDGLTLHTLTSQQPTSIMGSCPSPPRTFLSIPIVDFSRWSSPQATHESKLAVAKDLIQAFQTVGFVYIVNHGLPQNLIDKAFLTAQEFFALPLNDKLLAPHPPNPDHHRGYSSPGLEKVSQYMDGDTSVEEALREVVDCKESYEVGSEQNAIQPNIWLPELVLPGFRSFTTEFYWACHAVAEEILRCIAVGLELDDPETLNRFHSGHNNQLRLLHYPEVAAEEMEAGKVTRIGAHSDWGSITMLFQDDCGGLEVEDPRKEGSFVPATPVEGACVVNVGDLLMRWSNGESTILNRVLLGCL